MSLLAPPPYLFTAGAEAPPPADSHLPVNVPEFRLHRRNVVQAGLEFQNRVVFVLQRKRLIYCRTVGRSCSSVRTEPPRFCRRLSGSDTGPAVSSTMDDPSP
ncbi:hypothetical protein FQA47_004379 [Oryzias melastigma]|uniref:Uncharacterized protein n=1 Tax=Oryzias melastigma TaxID=30732 RepID=A0A834FJ99_ORYME|nr:hypothetical protein FQA47_004379 [Oryzias melastigma]